MEKPLIFLLLVCAILGAGIILSFYNTQFIIQDIIIKEENILPDSAVEIPKELDPSFREIGVFAVVVLENFEVNTISISVFDPLGSKIISKIAEKELTEEIFEINSDGTYKLEIQNSGLEESKISVGFGYIPDPSTRSIGIMGVSLLIVGLIGIFGIGVYLVLNRKKRNIS